MHDPYRIMNREFGNPGLKSTCAAVRQPFYSSLGFSPHHHPLAMLRPALPEPLVRADDLEGGRDGSLVRLAWLVVCRQRLATARGMLFMLLGDEPALAKVIVHTPVYEEHRPVVRGYPFLVVTGRTPLVHK